MIESTLRGIVISALRRYSAFAVENRVHDGTPDICSTLGWIECKCVNKLPIRKTSKVGIDLRISQQFWLRKWNHCNGSALVITVVCEEWFIHSGRWSAEYMVNSTEHQLRVNALKIWNKRPTYTNLRKELVLLHAQR